MSYTSSSVSYSEPSTIPSAGSSGSGNGCCSKASAELKLYQAFIFSIPVFFTFILLFLFYLFYLRRRRVDWSSLRMRNNLSFHSSESDESSRAELGLKKEVREMLPIIVFKESFSVNDTLCSVCLGDYQAEEKLQQIPACGHTFHMDCIDHWLSTHATCPLCRQSILVSTKDLNETLDVQSEREDESSHPQNGEETSPVSSSEHCEDSQQEEQSEASHEDADEGLPITHEDEETDLRDVEMARQLSCRKTDHSSCGCRDEACLNGGGEG